MKIHVNNNYNKILIPEVPDWNSIPSNQSYSGPIRKTSKIFFDENRLKIYPIYSGSIRDFNPNDSDIVIKSRIGPEWISLSRIDFKLIYIERDSSRFSDWFGNKLWNDSNSLELTSFPKHSSGKLQKTEHNFLFDYPRHLIRSSDLELSPFEINWKLGSDYSGLEFSDWVELSKIDLQSICIKQYFVELTRIGVE